MAVRSAEINVMAASAVKVARALARDFIELEQLQASEAGSANFTDRSFNNGAGIMQETLIKAIEKIHTVKGEFGPWINTVLRNTFLDEWRKNHNLNEKFTFLSLDTLDAGKEKGDDQGPNKAERLVNKHSASPSAEDDHMDESAQERVVNLIRTSLSQGEADFFLAYQEDPNPKTSKDKVKYHRLKKKLIRDLLRRWVQSGESLEDIMTARQAKVLSAKYSLDRREADIFKEQGLSDKAELDQLLADGTLRLFNALCAERASN